MIRPHPNGAVLTVRVTPRSSRDSIDGETKSETGQATALKVRLTTPPIEDRANSVLRKLLARILRVPVSAVKILSGEKSRTKRVLIEGITAAQTRKLLGEIEA